MGAVFKNPNTLHGKKVELTRGGKKVSGVLLATSLRENEEENFNFRWINENGATCVSAVSDDEVEILKNPVQPEGADSVAKRDKIELEEVEEEMIEEGVEDSIIDTIDDIIDNESTEETNNDVKKNEPDFEW